MRKLFLLLCLLAVPALGQHNGTVVGSPTFAATKFGNGIAPGGAGNYISLPTGTCNYTSPTSSFAIEAWVASVSTSPSTQIFVSCSGSGSSIAVYMAVNTSNGHFLVAVSGTGGFSGGAMLDSGLVVNDGSYHDCILSMSGGMMLSTFCTNASNVWVAGASFTGSFAGLTQTSGVIGNFVNAPSSGYNFTGAEDEVVFWNYAKSPVAGSAAPSAPYTGTETGLTALYHLQADGTDSASSGPTSTTIDPSSGAILYSPYNWNVVSGSAKTVNSGAYFRTIFTGTSAALGFNMTNAAAPYSQVWCRIDDQSWTQYTMASSVALGSGLASRAHLLECVVKSTSDTITRWPAASQTMLTMTGIVLDSGATVTLPTRRTKNCILFGDSITDGVRTINNTTANDTDRNDVLGAYSYLLTAATDCEWGIIGFGATGISVSGSGGVPALPSSYNLIYTGVARSFTSPAPDLVVYNEGTNDGSTNIVSAYTGVVNAILTAAPNARQLLLRPFGGNQAANVQAVVAAVNSPKVSYVDTTGWFNLADSSDGLHPYNYSSYGLIGPKLLPYINAALYPPGRSLAFY